MKNVAIPILVAVIFIVMALYMVTYQVARPNRCW